MRPLTSRVGLVFMIGWVLTSASARPASAEAVTSPGTTSGQVEHPRVPAFERHVLDSSGDPLAEGSLLLGELNCVACHKSPDAKAIARKQAPILDQVGARLRPEFFRTFLESPHAARPGTTMPDVLAKLPERERSEAVEALTHFLASTAVSQGPPPAPASVEKGKSLFSESGCLACHDPIGAGRSGLPTSVPLGDLSAKYTTRGLIVFLTDPLKARPSGRMPGMRLSPTEANSVAQYLIRDSGGRPRPRLVYSYYEGEWTKLPDFDEIQPISVGLAPGFDLTLGRRPQGFAFRFEGFLRIEREGDYTFHPRSCDGSRVVIDGKVASENDGIHEAKARPGHLHLTVGVHPFSAYVFNARGNAELDVTYTSAELSGRSIEPALFLTEEEAARPDDATQAPFAVNASLVERGRTLFAKVGCASCHQLQKGSAGIASGLSAPALDALPAEGGCLSNTPAAGRPFYNLSDPQRQALSKAIQGLKHGSSTPLDPKTVVARTLATLNCYACHERGKRGGVEDARNAFFATTQKEMGDEGRIPPKLDGAGAKLRPAYLEQIFKEGAKDRPYMLTRMPRYGEANASQLVAALGTLDKIAPVELPHFTVTPAQVKAQGRFLVGGEALGCIKCHTFKGVIAEGVQSIDMTLMTRRLNHDWFHRYLIAPQVYRSGTRMPEAWPSGQSLLPKVLGGNTQAQIEAIWQFLSDGAKAAEPYGLGREPIPLVPETEPIIYRNFIEGAGTRAIGVGYREKLNLAFDANEMRIALIWQGKFIDAARHWTGRSVGYQAPLGDNVASPAPGASFAMLAQDDETWPQRPAKESGYRFLGYRLDKGAVPTFLYNFGEIHVEDRPLPLASAATPTIRRTLTLTGPENAKRLWFRAAVGDAIAPAEDGWFVVDRAWKVRITAGGVPRIRKSAGKSELIVPVTFSGPSAVIVEEYSW